MDYEESLKELPLFVSYPRSGCNWIQPVMELYFDRHRAGKVPTSPSWLETPYENPLWTHTHDPNGVITTKFPAIFLWRNPVDAIYSQTRLSGNQTPQKIDQYCSEFKRLYNKWAKPENSGIHGGQPVLLLRYETVISHPHEQLRRISEFFEVPFDLERSEMAFNKVGNKKSVNERNGPDPRFKNPNSHTEEYERHREAFVKRWASGIKQKIGAFDESK